MAPKDVQQCEALGFCRLPTAPLSHVYRPAEFATPHKEFEYTFGYHVLLRRPSYAIDARLVWFLFRFRGRSDRVGAVAACQRDSGRVDGVFTRQLRRD